MISEQNDRWLGCVEGWPRANWYHLKLAGHVCDADDCPNAFHPAAKLARSPRPPKAHTAALCSTRFIPFAWNLTAREFDYVIEQCASAPRLRLQSSRLVRPTRPTNARTATTAILIGNLATRQSLDEPPVVGGEDVLIPAGQVEQRGGLHRDCRRQRRGVSLKRSGVAGAPKRCCVPDFMSMFGSCREIPKGALIAPIATNRWWCFKPISIAPHAPIETPATAGPRALRRSGNCVHERDEILDDEILVPGARVGNAVHIPALADRRRDNDHVARGQCPKPAAGRERRVVLAAAVQQIQDRISLPRRGIAVREENRRDLLASQRWLGTRTTVAGATSTGAAGACATP